MTTPDPVWASVAELSHAFAARALSPVDVVDALLARIAKLQNALGMTTMRRRPRPCCLRSSGMSLRTVSSEASA